MGRSKADPALLAERRRLQISNAAIKCFSKNGYHPTTIREVAEEAGVSIGMIYQYFSDKEELLYYSLSAVLNGYRAEIPAATKGIADPLARFCQAVHAYGRVQARSVDATTLTYRETKSLTRGHRDTLKQLELDTNELIASSVRECINLGLFSDVDVETFTYQIVLHSHAWSLKSWNFAGRMTIEEYVDRGLRLLLKAVLTGRGERHFQEIRCNCLLSEGTSPSEAKASVAR
jgi:AcrR family transcriptional regulator